MKRNIYLDFTRLLASLMVICLHTSYGTLDAKIVDIIKISSRWAVPFFFMTTGLFLYKEKTDSVVFPEKKIKTLISIHLVSSFIYLVVRFINNDNLKLGLVNILNGTYPHLWYIGSSILGIIIIWYINIIGLKRKILLISVALLIVTLLTDGYDVIIDKNIKYMPFLLSIPFIVIGSFISKKEYKKGKILIFSFIIFGFLLQFFENYILRFLSGKHENYRLFIGTIIFIVALIFLIKRNVDVNNKLINYLASLGVKYSLFIYLYHNVYIIFISYIIKQNSFLTKFVNLGLQPIIVFLLTITTGILLQKYSSKTFKILNGNIEF